MVAAVLVDAARRRAAYVVAVLAVLALLNDIDATRARDIDNAYQDGYEAGLGDRALGPGPCFRRRPTAGRGHPAARPA